jgi:hypothetical protein
MAQKEKLHEKIKNNPAIVFYSDEDQGYIAKAVDLKGCSAFGETPEQAELLKAGVLSQLDVENLKKGRQHA